MMVKKTAFITGANKGIGFEIARQLAQKGFHVIVSGRSKEKIEKAVAQLISIQPSSEGVVMDVSSTESIKYAFADLRKRTNKIDVLINSAAVLLDESTPLMNIPSSAFVETFNTNAFGAFFTAQTFRPLLNEGSRIINISSGGGQILEGITTWAPIYCMSKTLLNAITMQLAVVLKSEKISVNAVCPGWVRTDMGGSSASRSVSKGAETAVWLASEASPHLTGKFFRDKEEIHW
ncbi:MAG: SDR family oxidoreductase [Bacteroidetes bacterium]|nr:SDR family oxidoreductase [Bacteroidota bacterium]